MRKTSSCASSILAGVGRSTEFYQQGSPSHMEILVLNLEGEGISSSFKCESCTGGWQWRNFLERRRGCTCDEGGGRRQRPQDMAQQQRLPCSRAAGEEDALACSENAGRPHQKPNVHSSRLQHLVHRKGDIRLDSCMGLEVLHGFLSRRWWYRNTAKGSRDSSHLFLHHCGSGSWRRRI